MNSFVPFNATQESIIILKARKKHLVSCKSHSRMATFSNRRSYDKGTFSSSDLIKKIYRMDNIWPY